MRPDVRRWTRIALLVLTAVLLAVTAVSGYARSELSDREALSARVTSALDDDGVRAVMADRIVAGLTESVAPELLNLRPLLVPAVTAVLDTPPVRRGFERAVRARHRTLVDGDGRYVLEPGPAIRLVVRALRSVSPRFAAALPEDPRVRLLVLEPKGFELTTVRVIDGVAGWFWPLVAAALLAAVACAASAKDARGAVLGLGAAVAGAGLATAAIVTLAGSFVVDRAAHAGGLDDDTERDAVRAVWDALAGDLRSAALIAALAGAVAAAVAAGPVAAVPLRRVATRAVRAARSPRPVVRTARLLALALAGLALLVAPELALRASLLLVGAAMVLWGVVGLSARAAPARADGTSSPAVVGGVAVAALAIAILGTLAVLPSPGAGTADAGRAGDACNGQRELCDRRLNEVVFPATHNSYAAADEPGWFFASQRRGIARQLEDGVRAFLIDVHFGRPDPSSGRVRTDLAYEGSSRNKVARALSPEALRAADRLAGRVGAPLPPGDREVYLCHTLCELGAEPLREQLRLFARFLDEHPRDVVILFVEPYVPPVEIGEAMRETGLLEQAAELERDHPLPTLGELVQAGTRVVVLAEEDGGARPWYLPGFSFAQDTPLGAKRPGDLRCARFRGGPDAPLLLLNHWIPPFPPSVGRNEAIGGAVLRERAERCAAQRGQRPNLLAVDFYERTRVVEVSAELNRRP